MDQDRTPRQQSQSERRSSDLIRILVAAATVLLLALIVYGYVQGRWQWKGTGFDQQSLWDWLDLLIVPLALGIGGLWFQRAQRKRELVNQEQQQRRALKVEDQRSQDAALQAYLEYVGQLLLDVDKRLRAAEHGDDVRTLARARTLTLLGQLDGTRKRDVLRFLYEAKLITKRDSEGRFGRFSTVVPLASADLREVNLRELHMSGVNLSGTDLRDADLSDSVFRNMELRRADMRKAQLVNTLLGSSNLERSDLRGADLRHVDLVNADLMHADLRNADLREADLGGAKLYNADLSGANLSNAMMSTVKLDGTKLCGADLRGAFLGGAELTDTNLLDAKVSKEQLALAESIERVTLPDITWHV